MSDPQTDPLTDPLGLSTAVLSKLVDSFSSALDQAKTVVEADLDTQQITAVEQTISLGVGSLVSLMGTVSASTQNFLNKVGPTLDFSRTIGVDGSKSYGLSFSLNAGSTDLLKGGIGLRLQTHNA